MATGYQNNKSLCSGYPFTFGGTTIGQPVLINQLPKSVEIEGVILELKTKFHFSLVPLEKLAEKYEIKREDFFYESIHLFCKYIQQHNLLTYSVVNKFYYVTEEEKRSLIIRCDIPHLNELYDRLGAHFNIPLEYPVAHITLYTLQTNVGIYILDEASLGELAVPIQNKTTQELYQSLTQEK